MKPRRKAAAAERPITAPREIDRRIPPFCCGDAGVDELCQSIQIFFNAVKNRGVYIWRGSAEAAIDRVDEDEIGVGEDRLGVVDDFVGGKSGASFTRREKASWAKLENRFDRPRAARPSGEDKSDRARVVLFFFDIGDEEDLPQFLSISHDGAESRYGGVVEGAALELDRVLSDVQLRGKKFLFFFFLSEEGKGEEEKGKDRLKHRRHFV